MHFRGDDDRVDWTGKESRIVANPEWIARHPEAWGLLQDRLPRRPGHLWIATSGSTADAVAGPRWVELSYRAFLSAADGANRHLDSAPGDVWIHALPLFHVGGLAILARSFLSRARVVAGTDGRWSAAAFHRKAAEAGATLSALVPTQIYDLVAAGLRAPGSLRAVVVGGAALSESLRARAAALGWPLLPSYGATETCAQVATAALASAFLPEAPLKPLPHARLEVRDDGVLRVGGPSLLERHAQLRGGEVVLTDPKRDGWFDTDDLASLDASGLRILGRASETVKVLGENVPLGVLEAKLAAWLAERGSDAAFAVAPVDDERLGAALVLCLPEASRAAWRPEWLDAVNADLLPYERLRRVAFVERIPVTDLGKCRRRELSRLVGGEHG